MKNELSLDMTNVPKELKMLLRIVMVEEGKEIKGNLREELVDIDWDFFLQLAFHHRLFPLLYLKMKDQLIDFVPSYVIKTLAEKYKYNTMKMLKLSSEMVEINEMFSTEGISSLFLKGPVLAKDIYGDISHRTSSDLDLLIRIDDLDRADKLLQKHGYQKMENILSVFSEWKWRNHHISYFHPQKQSKVEIHWRLSPGPGKEPSFEELWKRKRVMVFSRSSICFLGKEDLLLFLITHGARHGWSRLRWLLDIHKLISQNINLEKSYRIFKEFKNSHLGGQAFILANQLLGTQLDKELTRNLIRNRSKGLAQSAIFYSERLINLHTDPVPRDVAKYHNRHMFSLMSSSQKIIFLLSILYPSHLDAQILPLPKCLHFLYFPLRPILWTLRKTRKQVLT